MDRNSIIGLVLIVAIVITFGILSKPSQKQLEAARRQNDSIMLVQKELQIKKQQLQAIQDTSKMKNTVQANDSTKTKSLMNKFGAFASSFKDSNEFITLENELLKIKISAIGGRPYSVQLKKYSRYDGSRVVLFDGDSTNMGLTFFSQNKLIETNGLYFKPMTSRKEIMVNKAADSVAMRLYAGANAYIEYLYTLLPNDYMVHFKINFVNMGDIIANNSNALDFNWKFDVPRQEKMGPNENGQSNIQYKYYDDNTDESLSATTAKPEDKEVKTKVKWIAFKQQFFSSILIAENSFSNASLHSVKFQDSSLYLKHYAATISVSYENKPSYTIPLKIYFGPNHFLTLKKYDLGLERVIFLGRSIVRWINQYLIIPVFNFLSIYFGNFGLIILLLTLIIRLALFPLTFKSYQSQAKMRVLKPEIDEINKKFPKDKAMEKQQATMALYRKAGVNPLGGCLPMLFQFPFLIAMFRFFPTSIELRHQSFLWATDLSTYDSILSLPFAIPYYGSHVSLFTILMTVTTIISMKMSNQTSAMDSQMPGMKTMMYIMPVMFMFMLNNFSSGLTYYYFLVNVVTIGQNEIFKRMINEEKLLKQIHANKAKPVKKSKFQERLEQVAKSRGMNLPKKK